MGATRTVRRGPAWVWVDRRSHHRSRAARPRLGQYGSMADLTDLLPGDPQAIAGYQVVRRLGIGGQGVVYLATAPSGRRVAIKQLRTGLSDERAKQQFTKEVAAARRVEPFCTARVLDADLEGPSPYVVSEF